MEIIHGDCLEEMKKIPDESVDAIVTDPPYELGFMGKKWDSTGIAYNVELWQECLRVLKPGGHLLAFSGTRTYHRMAVAIEDAGFEVRDMLEWIYASGFPKSLNIGKAVDKLQGNEREVEKHHIQSQTNPEIHAGGSVHITMPNNWKVTKGTSEWEGWGTALKPAHEPICMARKPLAEKTIVENVLKHGTGAIDIDGCRIPTSETLHTREGKPGGNFDDDNYEWKGKDNGQHEQGRFPANVICQDDALNDGSYTKDAGIGGRGKHGRGDGYGFKPTGLVDTEKITTGGSKSRYFDIDVWAEKHGLLQFPKASKRERNEGLDSYVTVKYNIPQTGGVLCKEESMVAVQLLQKVIFAQEPVSFNTDESGENITVQCHKDFLSTISTETKRIIGLKIYNSLMHSLTNESIQGANSEMANGGSLAENVVELRRWLLTTTKGNQELARGASRVVCEMLQIISEEGNWKQSSNIHSTVKPVHLMSWLVRLVSKEGDTVLDPFMGSGTTGVACKKLGRNFIGIEMEQDYCVIGKARIDATI